MTHPVCSTCGDELQATSKIFWSYRPEGWTIIDIENETPHIYCANDHENENDTVEVHSSLCDAINTFTSQVIACDPDDTLGEIAIDAEGTLVRQGRIKPRL